MRQGEADGHKNHEEDDLEGLHLFSKCMIHISWDFAQVKLAVSKKALKKYLKTIFPSFAES